MMKVNAIRSKWMFALMAVLLFAAPLAASAATAPQAHSGCPGAKAAEAPQMAPGCMGMQGGSMAPGCMGMQGGAMAPGCMGMQGQGMGAPMGGEGMEEGDCMARCMQMLEQFGLNDVQRVSVQRICEDVRGQMIQMRKDLMSVRNELRGELMQDNPSPDDVRELVNRAGGIQTSMRLAQVECLLKVREILTPEQRDQLMMRGAAMMGPRGGMGACMADCQCSKGGPCTCSGQPGPCKCGTCTCGGRGACMGRGMGQCMQGGQGACMGRGMGGGACMGGGQGARMGRGMCQGQCGGACMQGGQGACMGRGMGKCMHGGEGACMGMARKCGRGEGRAWTNRGPRHHRRLCDGMSPLIHPKGQTHHPMSRMKKAPGAKDERGCHRGDKADMGAWMNEQLASAGAGPCGAPAPDMPGGE